MPKNPLAIERMPPATLAALEQLGADLAVARLRRKESMLSWSKRIGVTVPTLIRMERGDPGVGMGIYATALWLINRISALGELASPQTDLGALELDVRVALEMREARAAASAEGRLRRQEARSP